MIGRQSLLAAALAVVTTGCASQSQMLAEKQDGERSRRRWRAGASR